VIARDLTLSSLYAARDKLGELIVRWAPEPPVGGGVPPPTGRGQAHEQSEPDEATRLTQAATLRQLLLARDQVSAAVNAVIGIAFRDVPAPELLAAARALAATTAQLESFGKSVAEVNEVLKRVDQALELTAKVLALAV
jgi:hypothetical protein